MQLQFPITTLSKSWGRRLGRVFTTSSVSVMVTGCYHWICHLNCQSPSYTGWDILPYTRATRNNKFWYVLSVYFGVMFAFRSPSCSSLVVERYPHPLPHIFRSSSRNTRVSSVLRAVQLQVASVEKRPFLTFDLLMLFSHVFKRYQISSTCNWRYSKNAKPKNGGEMQQSVCMIQWMCNVIPEFSSIICPLLYISESVYNWAGKCTPSGVVKTSLAYLNNPAVAVWIPQGSNNFSHVCASSHAEVSVAMEGGLWQLVACENQSCGG